jgi:predicted nucleic acid-binding Zn ribbon protein
MKDVRRSRGFEPLGSIGAHALGLSAARAKDLELQAAWRHVAGPAIARRASVLGLRRGVLDLAVAEPAWRRALLNLLPELGARFARHHPALGVTRFRIIDGQDLRA